MKQKDKPGYGRVWDEDEFIATLDLYFKTNPNERDANNSKVQKVARLLMRTPASIVYRLGNYAAVDPASQLKGFDNGGKGVRKMFDRYGQDKVALDKLAKSIWGKYSDRLRVDTSAIRELVQKYDGDQEDPLLEKCEELHKTFLSKWPLAKLAEVLTLENYVIGTGGTDTFCYWVERKTRSLGSILGSKSDKFKVYFDKEKQDYKWIKGHSSAIEAFEFTKREILKILDSAHNDDFVSIKNNEFFKNSHMFRGKLLYLYFPEKFLNIFSEEHVDFFLERLGIEYLPSEHIMDKQAKLLSYKNLSNEMRAWSNNRFAYFLNRQFTPPSHRGHTGSYGPKDAAKREEGEYALPPVSSVEVHLLELGDIPRREKSSSVKKKGNGGKGDYLAESIRNMKLGDQGEEIVFKHEREYLIAKGRPDLADKVKRVSLEDDGLGYDILSFTSEGKPKHIEVKATRSNVSQSAPFYFTENERLVMCEHIEDYYIYRVFAANTVNPRLLIIDSRMLNEHFRLTTKLWEIALA